MYIIRQLQGIHVIRLFKTHDCLIFYRLNTIIGIYNNVFLQLLIISVSVISYIILLKFLIVFIYLLHFYDHFQRSHLQEIIPLSFLYTMSTEKKQNQTPMILVSIAVFVILIKFTTHLLHLQFLTVLIRKLVSY